jgi:hypothetical protein
MTSIQFELSGETGKGVYAIVDEADYDKVYQHKWYPSFTSNTVYVWRPYRQKEGMGDRNQMLHRMLLAARAGQVIDHINHNGLDNRRENLRFVTSSGNQYNKQMKATLAVSGISNVYKWDKRATTSFFVGFDAGEASETFGSYRSLKMAEKVASKVREQLILRSGTMPPEQLIKTIRDEMKENGEINVWI